LLRKKKHKTKEYEKIKSEKREKEKIKIFVFWPMIFVCLFLAYLSLIQTLNFENVVYKINYKSL